MNSKSIVNRYREAAKRMYGLSDAEVRAAIYSPSDDPGEWAPNSAAIINLETGHLPISYWGYDFLGECFRLSGAAGWGYIECINPAVCAVYQ